MKASKENFLARSRIAYDPYPDTGETGDAYDIELPQILEEVRARIQFLDKPGKAIVFEQVKV